MEELSLEDKVLTDDENDSSDSVNESDDELSVDEDILGIDKRLADFNYQSAGVEVMEDVDRISVEMYRHLMNTKIDSLLDTEVSNLKLPYKPSDFQRVSINALGQRMNVVLVSPTGSGKMSVPLLATLVLKKKLNKGLV